MAVPTTFDHRVTSDSLPHAYWLARAAEPAHQDKDTVERQARDRGFTEVRHHETAFAPPFPLQDTQAVTMTGEHMVVTAFRGTEPQQNAGPLHAQLPRRAGEEPRPTVVAIRARSGPDSREPALPAVEF
ncbi:hypothetical protein [Kitasatospora purpeofusca]|uniref:hypothetical protein n=1 Tax=Kitasatospora purpeofusca TaxID=67352 RepID=UPI003826A88C